MGRLKGVFHPAAGLITRGNAARCCFPELKCWFWQGSWGWASSPLEEMLAGFAQSHGTQPAAQGLLRPAQRKPTANAEISCLRLFRLRPAIQGGKRVLLPPPCPWQPREQFFIVTHSCPWKTFHPSQHLQSLHIGPFAVTQTFALSPGCRSASHTKPLQETQSSASWN